MADEKVLMERTNQSGKLKAIYFTYTFPEPTEAVELEQSNGWHITIAGRKNIRALARVLAKAGGLEVIGKKKP
jgi:hypothetical protein